MLELLMTTNYVKLGMIMTFAGVALFVYGMLMSFFMLMEKEKVDRLLKITIGVILLGLTVWVSGFIAKL